jgi:WD40 repeat protein
MDKRQARGPVTALLPLPLGDNVSLLWACAGHLYLWCRDDQIQYQLPVFDMHTIHHIRHYSDQLNRLVVFGDKSIAFVSICQQGLVLDHSESTDDWVLDCKVVNDKENRRELLIVAYSHNMIDVREISTSTSSKLLQRCHCPAIAVMFAASIFGVVNGKILIASGSVFGHIYLWQANLIEHEESLKTSGEMLCQAKEHEGVVFRVVWNRAGTKFLTVSDDRTVRLWGVSFSEERCNLEQIYVGWGHMSRLWDAVFVDDLEEEVATCSEDGTVRIWNAQGQHHTVLNGHIESIWRLISVENGRYLVTGGNDSAVKFWDLSLHRNSSPAIELGTVQQVPIPKWPHVNQNVPEIVNMSEETGDIEADSTDPKKPKKKSGQHNNRRQNGVSTLHISPESNLAVIVLIDGMIWAIDMTNSKSANDYAWSPLLHLEKTVVTADVYFHSKNDNELVVDVVIAYIGGQATYLKLYLSFSIDTRVYSITQQQRVDWKPHDLKCVNLWILPELSSHINLPILCSATTKGICALWCIKNENSQVLLRFTTHREEIATSILEKIVDEKIFLIVGDARGCINIHQVQSPAEGHQWIIGDLQYFHRVHGKDPVSSISSYGFNSFLSVGHDSTIQFFVLYSNNSSNSSKSCWQLVNSMSTHPIHTPDQIFVPPIASSNPSSVPQKSIIIAGYHGNSFIVFDILQSYQLMRIDGGGWKRPHRCNVTFPGQLKNSVGASPTVLFVCPVPVGKNETELQFFGSVSATNTESLENENNYHVQLNSSGFGRVNNSSIIVSAPRPLHDILVIGGEDCTVKMYDLPSLQLLQETTLAKNSTLKSLSTSSCGTENQKGIVLGGGGKLLYYIWSYDFKEVTKDIPLRKLVVGTVWPQATQDHRILSVESCYLNQTVSDNYNVQDNFLLFLSDSRGILNVLSLQLDFESNEQKPYLIQSLYEIAVSENPLLSSSLLPLYVMPSLDEELLVHIICCVGDTKGSVHMLGIPTSSSKFR